jgi:hypothetical protein
MIAHFAVEGQFLSSDSDKSLLQHCSSTAMVCKVESYLPSIVESSAYSAGSFNVGDLLKAPSSNQSNVAKPDIEEWTSALESKFRRLAESKALNDLSLKGKIEFERLAALRRQLKNPRTGEDVLIEYEQRLLTRKLVNALTEYVTFHKSPHQKGRPA